MGKRHCIWGVLVNIGLTRLNRLDSGFGLLSTLKWLNPVLCSLPFHIEIKIFYAYILFSSWDVQLIQSHRDKTIHCDKTSKFETPYPVLPASTKAAKPLPSVPSLN